MWVVENVYVLSDITSVVENTLVNSTTLNLDEVHVSSEGTSDVVDVLMESSTLILDDIYIHEEDTSDFEHVLVESRMHVQVARHSLATAMIEDGIEHETVATSIVTSSKPLESPRVDCQTHTSDMRRKGRFIS